MYVRVGRCVAETTDTQSPGLMTGTTSVISGAVHHDIEHKWSAHHYVLFYPGNNCTVTKDITFHPFHGGGIIVKVSKISVFQYRLEDEVIT